MYNFPTIVIDDFFKEPLYIRDYALSLDYYNGIQYSGTRSDNLFNINKHFAECVCNKLLMSCGIPATKFSAQVYFHLTGEEFGNHGWPHRDFDTFDTGDTFASVTYLNPDVRGLNSGTSLYKLKDFSNLEFLNTTVNEMRETFKNGDNLDKRKEFVNKFDETVRVGGAFNRTIAYDARKFHCGNEYFGTTKEDKRLTMLIFFKNIITTLPYSLTPIAYTDMLNTL